MNLIGIPLGLHPVGPNDDGCDREPGPRDKIVEPAQNRGSRQRDGDLFFQFPERRHLRGLAGVDATSREGELARVVAQVHGPLGEEKRGFAVRLDQRKGDRRGLPRIRRDLWLE